MVFLIGSVGIASASALPGTPLYPAKLTVERVQLLLAYTPEQQTQAHLAIAAARLREAQAENHLGHATQIPSLIQSSEDQLAAAETAAAKVTSPGYHEQVAQTIAALRSEQRDIPPVVAASRARPSSVVTATKPAEEQPIAVPSSKPTEPPGTHDVSAPGDRSDKAHTEKENSATAPVAPPVANTNPTPSGAAPESRVDPSEQLLKTLIGQAMAGDATDATATSQAYVLSIHAQVPDNDGATNRLRSQLAQLQRTLPRAPVSTRPAIQNAINAIEALLGTTPGVNRQSGGAPTSGSESSNQSASPASSDNHRGSPGTSDSENHGNAGGDGAGNSKEH
jgi:hypothetical protein